MNPQTLLMIGGAALVAWYFLGLHADAAAAPPATKPGDKPTGAPVNTGTGAGAGGGTGSGGTGTGTGTNNNPPPTSTITLLQKLNAANTNTDKLANADEWNYYYASVLGNGATQPAPESFLPTDVPRDGRFTAQAYMTMRGLSGLGDIGQLGVIFRSRPQGWN
jgi:hypothetical protein